MLATSTNTATVDGWSNSFFNFDQQIGWSNGQYAEYQNNSGSDYVSYHFRRAPGFFDIVAYSGSGNSGRNGRSGCPQFRRYS